jgi:hypothetical protein
MLINIIPVLFLITCLSPTNAPDFSIAIVRVSATGGTRLLGWVEARRGEILVLVEQKQCKA